MPTLEQLKTVGRAYGHWIEQPAVLYKAEKWAYGLGAAGIAGVGASDTFRAKPGRERRQIAVRDVSVLGLTAVFTFLAAMRFMRPVDLDVLAKEVIPPIREHLPALKQKYPNIAPLLDKLLRVNEKALDEAKDAKPLREKVSEKLSRQEFKDLVSGFRAKGNEGLEDLNKILDVDEKGTGHFLKDVWNDLKTAISFFGVGLVACVSGLSGGLLANKINHTSSQKATSNMIKEGIFQFIANIALCAVGAGVAMSALNIPAARKALTKMGPLGRLARIAGIGTGLSLGIFGGGVIANKVGQHWVNPLLDKIEGRTPNPYAEASKQGGKRKIEFWDAILHLDDLPTALALAGVAIVEPFIPLFFAFSGYRTGIGYRNDDPHHHHHGRQKQPVGHPPLTAEQTTLPARLKLY